ncbi:MAG: hypothetical protein GY930_18270, partial [bacterium]|nr:hypothetical protein [bacterium]
MDIKNDGLMRWFNHKLSPQQVNRVWSALALHKKLFTFSTTTGRVLFQAFRNPLRDMRTAIVNTRTSGSSMGYMKDCLIAIGREYQRAWGGKEPMTEGQKEFFRLGLSYSDEMSQDAFAGRRTITGVAGGKVTKIENAWTWMLEMLQAPERAVRTVEVQRYGKEVLAERNAELRAAQGKLTKYATEMRGVKKLEALEELSFDDKLDLLLAAKRVSTNFTVAGRTARVWNRFIPFFNAQIQGPRDTYRAIMADGDADRRADKLTLAAAHFTVPALIAWLFVKDEDWYIELTPEEKASAWYVPVGGGEWLTLPLPFEIGTIFSAMPVLLADAAYRESPKETEWFVSRYVANLMQAGEHLWDAAPGIFPPSVRAATDM